MNAHEEPLCRTDGTLIRISATTIRRGRPPDNGAVMKVPGVRMPFGDNGFVSFVPIFFPAIRIPDGADTLPWLKREEGQGNCAIE
ncbi:hypothetical protein [Streptomyces peucetius]